jgi:hypothetical protein
LALDVGTIRKHFSASGQEVYDIWRDLRSDIFLKDVPLYSYYALARYYDFIDEAPSNQVLNKATEALNRDMSEQDWATFYWFQGYDDRREAVVNANRHFAGLVGYIRLAKLVGNADAEKLGRALLAKAAVLRLGMAKYPRYLYEKHLIDMPPEPDWQVRFTAGTWSSAPIFNYSWTGPYDDARQVAVMDQFEVFLFDHSGFKKESRPYASWIYPDDYSLNPAVISNRGLGSAHLTPFRDMVPEMARLLDIYAKQDVEIYINKVEALFPHWYAAFTEGMLGNEHNLNHPIDAFQLFMAKTWIQGEDPAKMAQYLDIPWLREADLFYTQKLAETIKSYRSIVWDDTLALRATPADQSVYLNWDFYTSLPAESTWQINYQGPAGDQPSPIKNIPIDNRAYMISGLTNYSWYTITLQAVSNGNPFLTSNTIMVMPTDHIVYLPVIFHDN